MKSFFENITLEKVEPLDNGFERIVLFNFFILVFFTFLGTTIPFQVRTIDPYEAETTNIVNQIVFVFLFLSSLFVIIQNPRNTSIFIRKEKFLTIFITICLISSVWSDYSFLSIKRSFQLLTTYITIFNVILNARLSIIVKVFKVVSIFYIGITYISGFFIPQAIDPEFGTWRGIEIHKNLLGHTALMIFVLTLFFHQEEVNKKEKIISIILSILSVGMILLSGSTTNLVALILIFFTLVVLYLDKVFVTVGISRIFSSLSIIFLSLFAVLTSLLSKDLVSQSTALFGKNSSFTGRDVIWAYIWNEIQRKWLLGYGFGTYWIMGTSVIDRFVLSVGWEVNEAHNGYLEIMLGLGLIGFIFFLMFLLAFIKRIIKIDYKIALLTLISILVVNFSESFVFQPRGSSTLVLMFFYLLVTSLYPEKSEEN